MSIGEDFILGKETLSSFKLTRNVSAAFLN